MTIEKFLHLYFAQIEIVVNDDKEVSAVLTEHQTQGDVHLCAGSSDTVEGALDALLVDYEEWIKTALR